jgi:hypothetical protein
VSLGPQERWADPEAELWSPAGGERAKGGAPGAPAEGGAPGAAPCEGPGAGTAGNGAPAGGRAKRFLPFSAGARDCVGRSLATINYKMLLALLLGHFRFRLADEARGPPAGMAPSWRHCDAKPSLNGPRLVPLTALAESLLLQPCSQHGSVVFGAAWVWWTRRHCELHCLRVEARAPEGNFQDQDSDLALTLHALQRA